MLSGPFAAGISGQTDPQMCIRDREKPILENSMQINKDKTIKKELNKDCIKYPSINLSESIGSIDRYRQNIKQIKDNIDYDSLVFNYDKSVIDEIVKVMAEVMTVNVPYYTIEKRQYPAELVKHRFLEIDYRKMDVNAKVKM